MTSKKWLKELKKSIKNASYGERQSIVWYYEEMINDRIEGGESEEDVLADLGSPYSVAEKISQKNGDYSYKDSGKFGDFSSKNTKRDRKLPIWLIIILGFFGVIIAIPVLAVWFSVLVTFGALSFSGIIIAIVGVVSTVIAVVMAILGSVEAGVALIGACIAVTGVGLLLIGGFFFTTKEFAKLSNKLIRKLLRVKL